MRISGGLLVSEGLSYEKAYLYRHEISIVQHILIDNKDIDLEISRYESALRTLIEESKATVVASDEERSLIDMHIEMLSDPEINNRVRDSIKGKLYNAAWAVSAVIDEYVDILANNRDEYLSERAADFEDVKKKLVNKLLGKDERLTLSEPSVLVADYILPSEIISLDKSMLKGIVVEKGGRTSHVAILARSLAIPAILALKDITKNIKKGDNVIVDGIEGDVIVNPTQEELAFYEKELESRRRKERALKESTRLPSITKDGHSISLFCNIEGVEGLDGVIESGAEGIGLFRTEFLFLQKDLFSDEEKKAEIYSRVASSMVGIGPVTIRTMDVGGDKFSDELGQEEDNPFLGSRSIRYAMEHRPLFRNQLISILKASVYGNIELMFPFISGPDELRRVLDFLEDVKEECREKNIPFDENMKVGTMIEVPSAAIASDLIADMVDFMSIGTNDLIQYTIAVDRGNSRVATLYTPLHPAVLRLLKLVVDNGEKKGKPVSICGELASSLEIIPVLVGLGIRKLSMVPSAILKAKERIRGLVYAECKALVDRLLLLDSEERIKKELEDFNNGRA